MRACDQTSIFSTGGKFRPDYGLLLELHTHTPVTRSYALLSNIHCTYIVTPIQTLQVIQWCQECARTGG